MKRLFVMVLLSVTFAFLAAGSLYAADAADSGTDGQAAPIQGIDRVETIVYGGPQSGGLLPRLSQVEKDLFGRELPGSLTERQQALLTFVEEGSPTQPSILFKMAVAEWVTLRRTNPSQSMAYRINLLERTLENEIQEGALSARLERVLAKLLPGGVSAANVQVPAHTVMKAKFLTTLTVRTVKKGDVVALELTEDCIVGGTLAAPKGNRVFAEITKVRMPRSFGRPSEINLEFKNVEALDGNMTAVYIGPAAQKAMEIDTGAVGAGAASIAGAVLIGPVGLATGFLVRGNDKQIEEGTVVYVETTEQAGVLGFQIPTTLNTVAETEQNLPQGGYQQDTSY